MTFCLFILIIFCVACQPKSDAGLQYLDVAALRMLLDSVVAYDDAGRFDDAHRVLLDIRRACPPSLPNDVYTRYYARVAGVCFNLGQYDVAIDAAAILANDVESPDDEARRFGAIFLAHSLKKAGDTALALIWYHKALAQSKQHNSRDMHVNIAWLSVAVGQYDSALVHVDVADSLYRTESRVDGNSLLLYDLIRTRAFAGLGNHLSASTALTRFTNTLESRRPMTETKEIDVRLSMLNGLWRDSLRVAGLVPAWPALRSRILDVQQLDLHTRASRVVTERTFDFDSAASYTLVPLPLTHATRPIPDCSNGSIITAYATDAYGWQWVATIHGLHLRIGQSLVPITVPISPKLGLALRSLSISGDTISLTHFGNETSIVALSQLVPSRRRQKGAPATPRVTVVASKTHRISGLVTLGDSVLWFAGQHVALGTLAGPTSPWKSVRSTPSLPPTASLQCGYRESDDCVLVGTSHGLWRMNVQSRAMHQLQMRGQSRDTDTVVGLMCLTDGEWAIRLAREDAHRMRVEGNIAFIIPLQEATPYRVTHQQGREPITTHQQHYASLADVDLPTRVLQSYRFPKAINDYRLNIAADTLIVWPHAFGALIEDVPTGELQSLRVDDSDWQPDVRHALMMHPQCHAFISSGKAYIVAGEWVRPTSHNTIVAVRRSNNEAFTVVGHGDELRIDDEQRSIQAIAGLPSTFGSIRRNVRWQASWSDVLAHSQTGRLIAMLRVPPGEHTLVATPSGSMEGVVAQVSVSRRLMEQWWVWPALGVIVAAGVGVTMLYLRTIRRQRTVERQQALLLERTQIGNDLHDSLGGMLVRINLMANRSKSSDGFEIGRLAREASRTLRDIIWSVSNQQTLDASIAVLTERLTQAAAEANLALTMHVEPVPPIALSPSALRNVILIFTEGMTNIVRHASASAAEFDCRSTPEATVVSLVDNGAGFDVGTSKPGIGLRSMQARASTSGFGLHITSIIGEGTTIQITIPHIPL